MVNRYILISLVTFLFFCKVNAQTAVVGKDLDIVMSDTQLKDNFPLVARLCFFTGRKKLQGNPSVSLHHLAVPLEIHQPPGQILAWDIMTLHEAF